MFRKLNLPLKPGRVGNSKAVSGLPGEVRSSANANWQARWTGTNLGSPPVTPESVEAVGPLKPLVFLQNGNELLHRRAEHLVFLINGGERTVVFAIFQLHLGEG